MATNLRQELLEDRKLKIDFIAGPDSYKRLPGLIKEALADHGPSAIDQSRKAYDLTLSEFETYSDVYPQREAGVNAWIAVMRGCNNFCTFCVVPYTRGRERSRSVDNVVAEAVRLAADGFKQVTLLGQNVNSYFSEGKDFADLIEAVSRVKGIERIRFTSPHPKDFPEKLLNVVAENPRVCKHIHLPLQSGSDRILDLMNRTYTRAEYLALAGRMRKLIPGLALSTDVIVGFSSETDEDFENTIKVMAEVEFDAAFTFKYSERKGTIAERKHPDDVPDAVKTERITRLVDLQRKNTEAKNRLHIGRTRTVLIEAVSTPKSTDFCQGRTDDNKIVIIPQTGLTLGQMPQVTITDAGVSVLKGRLTGRPESLPAHTKTCIS